MTWWPVGAPRAQPQPAGAVDPERHLATAVDAAAIGRV